MKPHLFILDEIHLLDADENRMDIGDSVLSTLFAAGGKRNIRLVLANQLLSNVPGEIFGNLACTIITRLQFPKCLGAAIRSLGLKGEQATKLLGLRKREAVVQYSDHPSPFLVRIDELSFPPRPDETTLEKMAEAFLSKVTWSEDALQGSQVKDGASGAPADPDALTGDALRVFLRMAERSAEPTTDRCDALGFDRARDLRARKRLEAKGFIAEVEPRIGKLKFHRITDKGADWTKRHAITVKRYKSGPVHEYLLNEIEKAIGSVSPKFRFQRHSEIAREHGLQPDSALHLPDGWRIIIEICCNNLDYEARNLTKERQIEGVDMVIAVTPNQRLKDALERALERRRVNESAARTSAPLVVLDAGEALSADFDWVTVLERTT